MPSDRPTAAAAASVMPLMAELSALRQDIARLQQREQALLARLGAQDMAKPPALPRPGWPMQRAVAMQ